MTWKEALVDFQNVLAKATPIVSEGVKIINALQPVLNIAETVDPALMPAIQVLENVIANSRLAISDTASVVNSLNQLKQLAAAAVPAPTTPENK